MLYFDLGQTRTHEIRRCCLAAVRSELCDAYLIIRQGKIGPKGGRSKYSVDGYFLQETRFPPGDFPPGWRELLFAHDHGDKPDVYAVTIPTRGTRGHCNCKGFETGGNCKHIDAAYHLVYIVGWSPDAPAVATDLEQELFGADPACLV